MSAMRIPAARIGASYALLRRSVNVTALRQAQQRLWLVERHRTLAIKTFSSLTRNKSTTTTAAQALTTTTSSWLNPRELFMRLIQEKEDKSDFYVNRPQTALERIKNFPEGVKGLIRDMLQYKAIRDTPMNSWQIQYPDGRQIQFGRIPRRQYQQQRQLRKDFRTMFPLVVIWIPPITGLLPPILAVVAPRQFMSSHFHNPYENESFAQIEYGQRVQAFPKLAEMFWNSLQYGKVGIQMQDVLAQTQLSNSNAGVAGEDDDDAGPILDSLTLYKTVFAAQDDAIGVQGGTSDTYLSIRNLPREYLLKLSLSIGINQYLPGWFSPWVTEFQPSEWLRSQVDRLSHLVCYDDAMLIEEGHHLNGCCTLTDDEVREACLMRGLPTTQSAKDDADRRRLFLTNHLKMIATVREDPDTKVRSDGFRLFTMHLAPLRYALEKLRDNTK